MSTISPRALLLDQLKLELTNSYAEISRLEMYSPEDGNIAVLRQRCRDLEGEYERRKAELRKKSLATEKSGFIAKVNWYNLSGWYLFAEDPTTWLLARLEEAGEYNCAHLNLDCITKLTPSQWERASKFLQTLPANPTPHAD